MKEAPTIANEVERLNDLDSYEVLDSISDGELDDIVQLASSICETPIALVSLVDKSRQWFKAAIGLGVAETSRSISFCGHAIEGTEFFEIPEATQDERFADNPLVVGDPKIRFYAGFPLISASGNALGTLCVIDREPKKLNPLQIESLRILSKQVMRNLEFKKQLKIQRKAFESRQILNQIVNSSGHIIIGTDVKGTISIFNPTAERLLGFLASEVVGKETPGIFHDNEEVLDHAITLSKDLDIPLAPGFRTFVERPDRNMLEQREWTYIRKDGSRFPVLLTISALRNEEGDIEGYLGSAVDLSVQKEMDKALRDAKSKNDIQRLRWEIGLKAAQIGVWEYNVLDGSLYWDEQMFRLYGHVPNDSIGSYELWQKSLHPCDRESAEENFRMALAEIKPFDTKFRVCLPDGRIRNLRAYAEWMRDDSGKVIKITGVNIDISRFEEIEKKIEETLLELERSNAELESFAYVASHDLQAPLRHITCYTELLNDKLKLETDVETLKWMRFISNGTSEMKSLIDGLLSYSRVQGNKVQHEDIDLNAILAKITTILRSDSPSLKVEAEKFPIFKGISGQIQQLFQNLIQNSLKFNRPGIDPLIEIFYVNMGEWHRFQVKDNGIGIAREHFERVFQIFQRLHTKDKYEGSGIGLAICKKVVNLHGGQIWIESEPGSGTSFFFTLKKM